MKTGFRFAIQKGLNNKQNELAQDVAWCFINAVAEHKGSFAKAYRTKGGRASYLARGNLGYTFGGLKDLGLTLRRLSKNKRVFGIMRLKDLEVKDLNITADKLNECMCPQYHGGGRKVRMLIPYENNFRTIYEIGEIKG